LKNQLKLFIDTRRSIGCKVLYESEIPERELRNFGNKFNHFLNLTDMSQIRTINGKTQRLIFRKSRRLKTGQVIYAPAGKSFPIWVDI